MTAAPFLRALAQNDYMIDGHMLPDGLQLLEAAREFERTIQAVHAAVRSAAHGRCGWHADDQPSGHLPLSNELVIAIYCEHEDEISAIWAAGEEIEEGLTMRQAVEIWLRQALCGE